MNRPVRGVLFHGNHVAQEPHPTRSVTAATRSVTCHPNSGRPKALAWPEPDDNRRRGVDDTGRHSHALLPLRGVWP